MNSEEMSNLPIFIPAYNEAKVIASVITGLHLAGFEQVYVVNDGSEDDTAAIAEAAGAVVLNHLINRGAGAATQTGICYARENNFSKMVLFDGDGQHFPKSIPALLKGMTYHQCDIVIGSRFVDRKSHIPGMRRFYNSLANIITNWFCIGRYSDSQSGLRLLNRKAIERLDLNIDGFGFCSEMIISGEQAQLKIKEVAIEVGYSEYSLSKGQDVFEGFSTALDLFRKIMIR